MLQLVPDAAVLQIKKYLGGGLTLHLSDSHLGLLTALRRGELSFAEGLSFFARMSSGRGFAGKPAHWPMSRYGTRHPQGL